MMSINDRLTLKSTRESDFFIVLMSWEASGEPCSPPTSPPRFFLLEPLCSCSKRSSCTFTAASSVSTEKGFACVWAAVPTPSHTGHGLRAAGTWAEAAGGGRDVPEHRPPPLPARTPQEAEFPQRRQQATQVRSPRLREGAFWRLLQASSKEAELRMHKAITGGEVEKGLKSWCRRKPPSRSLAWHFSVV